MRKLILTLALTSLLLALLALYYRCLYGFIMLVLASMALGVIVALNHRNSVMAIGKERTLNSVPRD